MNSEVGNLNLTHIVREARQNNGGPRPGLLLLHGRGADEADLMGLEVALDPRLTIVSPRAPFRAGPGFAWYGMAAIGSPHDDTLRTSLAELHAFIEGIVPAYNIDPAALFVMGFSQGAVMSAGIALTRPDRVRGVVMHSGYVPIHSGLDIQPGAAQGMPFFIAHGLYDDVIRVTFARQSRDYLQQAGATLTYQEYPIAHYIGEESLDDLSEWLIGHLDSL
jgi:phospholipase/carboxylesterase